MKPFARTGNRENSPSLYVLLVQTGGMQVRLAELVGVLALAQDGAFGQPTDAQLRAATIALALGERLGLDRSEREAIYWAAPLRYLGCTAHAHEVALLFGDDIGFRANSLLADMSNPAEMLRDVVTNAGAGRAPLARLGTIVAAIAGGREPVAMNFRTGCEAGDMLAARLAIPIGARAAMRFGFERWNGRGFPEGARGETIPVAMRAIHVACDAEALSRVQGRDRALAAIEQRSGSAYDPQVASAFLDCAGELLARAEACDPWEAWLQADPSGPTGLSGETLDSALGVIADFTDLKSPYTAGHSRGVAQLAAGAGERCGIVGEELVDLRRAALVHDLGRVCIPNSIWDKPGSLTHSERERMQLHPMRTEQLLRRCRELRGLAALAAAHHERPDGEGYPHRTAASNLPATARLLAAADRLRAMTEPRAHRPARSPSQAAEELEAEARTGGLDADAVSAVLTAAGERRSRRAQALYPDELTAREVEVLRLIARGESTKRVAAALVISVKTADRHIQNAYRKIGVSTRGAAALYTIERGLLEPSPAGGTR